MCLNTGDEEHQFKFKLEPLSRQGEVSLFTLGSLTSQVVSENL